MASCVAEFEFRLEADLLQNEPRRNCEHDAPRLDLPQLPADAKPERDVVAAIADCRQCVIEMDRCLRQDHNERLDERCHAAREPPCAIVDALTLDPVGRLVGIAQMEHGSFVVLPEIGELQLGDELRDQRLGIRPEPGRAEIVPACRHCGWDRKDASAEPRAGLEQRHAAALPEKTPGQGDAAQAASDDRRLQHRPSF